MSPTYLTRLALRYTSLVAAVLSLAMPAAAAAAPMLVIRGDGDGHGIGMSQYGADGYAQHGAGYPAILAHYYTGTALGTIGPTQTVRVLVATGRASFSGATAAAGRALRPLATYTVTAGPRGSLQVRGRAGAPVAAVPAPLRVSGPGPLHVPGAGTYRGALELSPDGHGGVQTVDVVGLEDYARGVVAAEMPASWPAAALEAQAVAARTYAITAGVGGDGYDLYADTRSQMYGGVGAETAATDAAVAATTGQIVTYQGRPAVTYFFASSGGWTENIENVWPGATPEPWLVGVPDPYDSAGGDPYHRWSEQLTVTAAAGRLGGLLHGTLRSIIAVRRGVSGRIVTAQVVGSRGRVTVTGGQLEAAFGLASTNATFTVTS